MVIRRVSSSARPCSGPTLYIGRFKGANALARFIIGEQLSICETIKKLRALQLFLLNISRTPVFEINFPEFPNRLERIGETASLTENS